MKKIILILIYFFSSISLTAQQYDDSKVPGKVVAYSPASSGKYIGSPSLAILPNGNYVASHDFFGPESNEHVRATSKIYTSKNRGKSWVQIAEIDGAFWSKLFVRQGKLWFLGTDRHHGNTLVRLSEDGGKSWTNPTNGTNGLILEGEYHCAPMPIIEHNGRIWRAMESAMGPIKKWGKRYGAFMLSAPVDADLLNADSWTSSNILYYDSTYLDGNFGGWLEGNAVVDKDGQMWDILRVDDRSTLEEKAARVKISADGTLATFDPKTGFIAFPGGSKKFTIRYDEATELYWTIANVIPEEIKRDINGKNPASIRNTQALYSSPDLVNWTQRKVLLQHPDIVKHGFQYVDWKFDGKDIIFLSRTAYDDGVGGARNNHDANFLTFHRIKKFRKHL
ncbi:exo-alpha-sialidase [Arenibacter aquaticus]|uniref:Exo-alpha-sialidase n=1 Tax=Arenibacter aquaticus TaxID=2489054 RepID=A0A3S0C9V0_9FLAO|nr:exo-alpha-sialidase [Arenibacter aquaticus]RTE55377.1 exo-alpha-sialidase [Arenibacter aquaticus]